MRDEQPSSIERAPPEDFESTQWSLVVAAGQRESVESVAALQRLCTAYWPPLYAYVSRRVADVHAAQDLTQAFFERLLEKGYLAAADPQRGRFRAFLLTAFKHFLSQEWEKSRAQKRGGGRLLISFESVYHANLAAGDLTPEQVFEREWAITLLARVMRRLQREMERAGKGQHFQRLKEVLTSDAGAAYASIAADLQLSEPAARMAASRMRKRYRELLRDEIAQTLSSQEDVEDEIRQLFAAFQIK